MMDYVELIGFIKQKYNAQDKAVIVFGGSYGGMLAAWLRMKFPSTFQGALAASAPILQFKNNTQQAETRYGQIITNDFAGVYPADQRCSKGIKEAFGYIQALQADGSQADWPFVSDIFKTCKNISKAGDLQNLYALLSNGYQYLAMTDYPYNSSFLEPMPAWPVNASCVAFKDIAPQDPEPYNKAVGLTDRQTKVLTALRDSISVYFNYTGQLQCTDFDNTDGTGTLAADGWNVLACNELPMPVSMSADSMFLEQPFNYTQYTQDCQTKYGLTP